MVAVRRLDIVLVALDPNLGSEIRKTRPCVVISPDIINLHSRTILIAAITHYDDEKAESPLFVAVSATLQTGLTQRSLVTTLQMRTIDKLRIIKRIGAFPRQQVEQLNDAIAMGAGLKEI